MEIIFIYIASVIIVGAVHWADYMDKMKAGVHTYLKDRVIHLYILPLIPVLNTILVLFILYDSLT